MTDPKKPRKQWHETASEKLCDVRNQTVFVDSLISTSRETAQAVAGKLAEALQTKKSGGLTSNLDT